MKNIKMTSLTEEEKKLVATMTGFYVANFGSAKVTCFNSDILRLLMIITRLDEENVKLKDAFVKCKEQRDTWCDAYDKYKILPKDYTKKICDAEIEEILK